MAKYAVVTASIPRLTPAARPVWFDGAWWDTPIYRRDHLPLDFRLPGPAILEQMDTTILIEPGDNATGDATTLPPPQRISKSVTTRQRPRPDR